MRTLFIFVLSLLNVSVLAEDALMDGGRSPDGSYQVRIARDAANDPSNYAIRIHVAGAPKPIFTLTDVGGYLHYPAAVERCHALWHPSSRFVAITDQGTKHSRELYVVAVHNTRTERLEIPNYVQQALRSVGATEIGLHCLSTPKSWKGDDLLVTLYFSIDTPEHGRRFYTCDVTLRIVHGRDRPLRIEVGKVAQPKEEEG